MNWCRSVTSFAALVCLLALNSGTVSGEVILTFDQSGVGNGVEIDPTYGDNVTQSPDSNGHGYGIVGSGTPNIDTFYTGQSGSAKLWTSGYGNLNNVLWLDELPSVTDPKLLVTFDDAANPNSDIYLRSFDLAAFGGSDVTVTNVRVLREGDSELWSNGSTLVSSGSRTTINFVNENGFGAGGISASDRLTIELDFTGMEGTTLENVGIDNIRFSQIAAVPEPSSGALLLVSSMAVFALRRRK